MSQGRFRFVDWYGLPRGIADTDDLQGVINTANEFQCEILDTENDNMTVYNCWSGWNKDWRKRNEQERIYQSI